MDIKIEGARELGEQLRLLPAVLSKKYLGRATFLAARVIRDEAVRLAPVKTGALRGAIAVFRRQRTAEAAEYDVGVRKIRITRKVARILRILRKAKGVQRLRLADDQFYWRFLEFGTSKMAPRPFLRPAFEAKKEEAVAAFRESLADGVQRAIADVGGKP